MSEWKAAGRASKEAEEQLWTRFRAAQDTFFAARAATFSERDAEQLANQQHRRRSSPRPRRSTRPDLKGAQARLRDISNT